LGCLFFNIQVFFAFQLFWVHLAVRSLLPPFDVLASIVLGSPNFSLSLLEPFDVLDARVPDASLSEFGCQGAMGRTSCSVIALDHARIVPFRSSMAEPSSIPQRTLCDVACVDSLQFVKRPLNV
jgi:hypothetical protein